MKQMAEYITLLENFAGMEVSIIRATKINKVLKAILKLESIPHEDEFNFKGRSKTLLDKWNKLMNEDTPVNGAVNGSHTEEKEADSAEPPATKDGKKDTANEPESAPETEKPTAEDESSPKSADADNMETDDSKADEKIEKVEEKTEEPVEKVSHTPRLLHLERALIRRLVASQRQPLKPSSPRHKQYS
jgi:hypothetical protein